MINTMHGRRSFTLLELMVVVTLMTLAVGMTVMGLDGLSETGRLRSAVTQVGSLLKLTRTQARSSGRPRLLVYPIGGDRMVVRTPLLDGSVVRWDDGVDYLIGGGTRIVKVLVEGETGDEGETDSTQVAVRIGADGHCRAHAVVLGLRDRGAVVVVRGLDEPIYALLDEQTQADTFDLLMLELAAHEKKKQGTVTH